MYRELNFYSLQAVCANTCQLSYSKHVKSHVTGIMGYQWCNLSLWYHVITTLIHWLSSDVTGIEYKLVLNI